MEQCRDVTQPNTQHCQRCWVAISVIIVASSSLSSYHHQYHHSNHFITHSHLFDCFVSFILLLFFFLSEPPFSLPYLSINNDHPLANGQTVNLTLGENVFVMCRVDGGFPPVLKIQGMHENQTGSVLVKKVIVTRDFDNASIQCAAQNYTQCYDLVTRVTVNLLSKNVSICL